MQALALAAPAVGLKSAPGKPPPKGKAARPAKKGKDDEDDDECGPLQKMKPTKAQARALKGKFIEVFWDGEAEWFEAEVLAFDEERKRHFVRYTADGYECEENLMGVGEEAQLWKHVIKTTARGASVKAEKAALMREATGFVPPPPPLPPAGMAPPAP